MSALRSRVRLIAVAWLLFQVASLSAFVREDCCAMHTAAMVHATAEAPACHETEPEPAPVPKDGDACPMHQDEAAACPMHRSSAAGCCGINNGCDGPNQPLTHLFSFVGLLDAPDVGMSPPASTPSVLPRPAPIVCRLVSPDAPPPKA